MNRTFFSRYEVRWWVGTRHISDPDFTIARKMVRMSRTWDTIPTVLTPGGATIPVRAVRLALIRFAVGTHHANRQQYHDVMTGRIGR